MRAMNGMGGDVFGGPHDPSPYAHTFGDRPDNGDAARNVAYQRRREEEEAAEYDHARGEAA